jgi:hypothetical protein
MAFRLYIESNHCSEMYVVNDGISIIAKFFLFYLFSNLKSSTAIGLMITLLAD